MGTGNLSRSNLASTSIPPTTYALCQNTHTPSESWFRSSPYQSWIYASRSLGTKSLRYLPMAISIEIPIYSSIYTICLIISNYHGCQSHRKASDKYLLHGDPHTGEYILYYQEVIWLGILWGSRMSRQTWDILMFAALWGCSCDALMGYSFFGACGIGKKGIQGCFLKKKKTFSNRWV